MTDLDAILRAVVADPADDTPRLVYAEVCDDAGEHERAEFIRVQCELARMPADEPFARVAEAVLAERLPRMSRLERNESRDILLPQCFPEARQRAADRDAKRKELRRRERELWNYGQPGAWVDALYPPFECILCIDEETVSRDRAADPILVVRRGFVDEIRTDLRAFVGGECERCGGDGLDAMADHHRATPCRQCRGTGRVGLDLAAVFAAHPIARVATDREPTAASHQSGAWHWTWVGNDADSRVGLPRKLMAALSASGIDGPFDTRDAAMDALSLACVNLGRTAAGLDPLT